MNVTRNDDGQRPDADPRVTEMLRAHYAAPQDDAYWQGFESRLMQRIGASLSGAVQELKPAWWSGFGEFRRLMAETRILVASLARVAQWLEDNPSAVLFGNRDAEYRSEGSGRR